MSTILGLAFPLVILWFVFRILCRSPLRVTSFNARRAALTVRSRTGANAALALAGINLAQLVLQLAEFNAGEGSPRQLGSWIVVALAVAFVFTLVAAEREAGFLVAVAGIAAGVLSTALHRGWDAVGAVVIIAILMVWVLGLARGLFRPLSP